MGVVEWEEMMGGAENVRNHGMVAMCLREGVVNLSQALYDRHAMLL